jgi:hypothetical protein
MPTFVPSGLPYLNHLYCDSDADVPEVFKIVDMTHLPNDNLWAITRQPVISALAYDETSSQWVVTASPTEGPFIAEPTIVHDTLSNVQRGLLRSRAIVSDNPDSVTLAALWSTPPLPSSEPEYKFNLIGRHFLDSAERRTYMVTDIFFDNTFQHWVCRRTPVDDNPVTDLPEDTFLLDYVYREMAANPSIASHSLRINE